MPVVGWKWLERTASDLSDDAWMATRGVLPAVPDAALSYTLAAVGSVLNAVATAVMDAVNDRDQQRVEALARAIHEFAAGTPVPVPSAN